MIPLKDNIPSKTFPFITITLLIINLVIFMHEMTIGDNIIKFVYVYGVIPKKFFMLRNYAPNNLGSLFIPLFTSLFLHAGWMHLIGNMMFLWIFADNVEDKFGHINFLVFYFFSGIIATIAQIYSNPISGAPIIGASGAIAGVLGAYFVFFPRSKISTLFFIIIIIRVIEIPAIVFLGFWFIMQFFNGVFGLGAESVSESGIAWWAHIGGFLTGLVIAMASRTKIFKRFFA